MSKYTNALYPDKINDLVDNDGNVNPSMVPGGVELDGNFLVIPEQERPSPIFEFDGVLFYHCHVFDLEALAAKGSDKRYDIFTGEELQSHTRAYLGTQTYNQVSVFLSNGYQYSVSLFGTPWPVTYTTMNWGCVEEQSDATSDTLWLPGCAAFCGHLSDDGKTFTAYWALTSELSLYIDSIKQGQSVIDINDKRVPALSQELKQFVDGQIIIPIDLYIGNTVTFRDIMELYPNKFQFAQDDAKSYYVCFPKGAHGQYLSFIRPTKIYLISLSWPNTITIYEQPLGQVAFSSSIMPYNPIAYISSSNYRRGDIDTPIVNYSYNEGQRISDANYNIAAKLDNNVTYSDGDYAMVGGMLKIRANNTWSEVKIGDVLKALKAAISASTSGTKWYKHEIHVLTIISTDSEPYTTADEIVNALNQYGAKRTFNGLLMRVVSAQKESNGNVRYIVITAGNDGSMFHDILPIAETSYPDTVTAL